MRMVGGRTARGAGRGAGASAPEAADPTTMPARPDDRRSEEERAVWDRLASLAFEASRSRRARSTHEMYTTLLEEGFTFVKHVHDADDGMPEEPKAHPLVTQHRQTV
jgi:hypothetical protein